MHNKFLDLSKVTMSRFEAPTTAFFNYLEFQGALFKWALTKDAIVPTLCNVLLDAEGHYSIMQLDSQKMLKLLMRCVELKDP
ncbi:hypothetical protein NPIL_423171 [Nephila pilipes]|uniref:Uncharacterized protein n=1 Tax=Nephila pilipes TaxID=299642 RepID=A0A8X6NAR0_NEPPI|nr:hypothetical protein NPIL_423171 [Nephila pilipes]